MPKIFRLLLVAAAILIGVIWFSHWSRTRATRNGAVRASNHQQKITPKAAGNASPANTAQTNTSQGKAATQEVASETAPSTIMVAQHPGPITEQPAGNALSPHPPNGFVTPSTQKFALYRQGDLTYRLNTQSGQACVLLASDALWQKPIVYQHGCNNR